MPAKHSGLSSHEPPQCRTEGRVGDSDLLQVLIKFSTPPRTIDGRVGDLLASPSHPPPLAPMPSFQSPRSSAVVRLQTRAGNVAILQPAGPGQAGASDLARAASIGPGRPQRPAHVPGRVDRGAPPQRAGACTREPTRSVPPRPTRAAAAPGAGTADARIRVAPRSPPAGDEVGLAAGGGEGGDRGQGVSADESVVAAEQVLRSGVQCARVQAGRGLAAVRAVRSSRPGCVIYNDYIGRWAGNSARATRWIEVKTYMTANKCIMK